MERLGPVPADDDGLVSNDPTVGLQGSGRLAFHSDLAFAAEPDLGASLYALDLVPGDAVLNVSDADVALTDAYQGRRRMTLTYPIINRSRRILWLVTGNDKAGPLVRLRDADPSIPAGRVRQDQGLLLADRAAAAELEAN